MESFREFIVEANYMRFLKKNKNLTDDQKEQLNKYFSKTNPQAGSRINWQGRDVRKWDFEDFEKHMMKYKSGRKAAFKKPKIPGRQGEDYWEIRLKTKVYYAAIPLNHDTATFMNSARYGCEGANYCIGYDGDVTNWDDIVIGEQQVPVYVTNGAEKWVVMIYPDNRNYDVWDKMNNYQKKNSTDIPGFDVKKNLLTSSLKKLYDDLREEFFSDDQRSQPDYSDAQDDYDKLVAEIERAREEVEENAEKFEAEMQEILDDTIKKYKERAKELNKRQEALEQEVSDLETEQLVEDPPYKWQGNTYSEEEFKELIQAKSDAYDVAYDAWNEVDDALTELEDMSTYEMPEHWDDYEWTDEVPDEDGAYERREHLSNYPEPSYYSDLEEYVEMFGGNLDSDTLKQDIWSYVFEGGYGDSADQVLARNDIYRPE